MLSGFQFWLSSLGPSIGKVSVSLCVMALRTG